MPALSPPTISLVPLAALLTGAALGYKWRDNTAKLHESREQQRYTQALNETLDRARRQEQTLYAQMEALSRDTEKQLEAVVSAERAAADTRLRDLAAQYAIVPPVQIPTLSQAARQKENPPECLPSCLENLMQWRKITQQRLTEID